MNTKSDRIIGLTGGLLQTMYESFVGIFASTIDYGCRITGDMVKTGGHLSGRRWNEAKSSLWCGAKRCGEASLMLPLAGTAHLLIDTFAGVIGGSLFGSPMNEEEVRFARSIFGQRIRLNHVRIVETGWEGRGMASGGAIYIDHRDLKSVSTRATFAHELTHQFQDSQWARAYRGTLRATWQAFQHMSKWKNVYRLDLPNMREWHRLEPESQAVVVEAWIEYRGLMESENEDERNTLAFYLDWRNVNVRDESHIARLDELLQQAGLFRGVDGTMTPRTWVC